jgi:hypothetical protein
MSAGRWDDMSGSSGLKVQAALPVDAGGVLSMVFRLSFSLRSRMALPRPK